MSYTCHKSYIGWWFWMLPGQVLFSKLVKSLRSLLPYTLRDPSNQLHLAPGRRVPVRSFQSSRKSPERLLTIKRPGDPKKARSLRQARDKAEESQAESWDKQLRKLKEAFVAEQDGGDLTLTKEQRGDVVGSSDTPPKPSKQKKKSDNVAGSSDTSTKPSKQEEKSGGVGSANTSPKPSKQKKKPESPTKTNDKTGATASAGLEASNIEDAFERIGNKLTLKKSPRDEDIHAAKKQADPKNKGSIGLQVDATAKSGIVLPPRPSQSALRKRRLALHKKDGRHRVGKGSKSKAAKFSVVRAVKATTHNAIEGLSSNGRVVGTIDTSALKLNAVDRELPPVPRLSYGLDRVLFNPGVYHLQDPRSQVYNFDPYLQKIMPVAEFDFTLLKRFVTSSRDQNLLQATKDEGKKYTGSTSSMTWKDGVYAIDADKEFDTSNVLSMLDDYEKYRKSNSESVSETSRTESEAYHYSTMGDFLMRSQLDAYDPRVPGSGMFDLKTRAVISIRMDVAAYEEGKDYEIRNRHGEWHLPEMDLALHGTDDLTLGDSEFKTSLQLLNTVLDRATARWPEQSLRLFVETRGKKGDPTYMYIFAKPVEESRIEAIQSSNKAKIEEFERRVLGLSSEDPESVEQVVSEWEALRSDIQNNLVQDEDDTGSSVGTKAPEETVHVNEEAPPSPWNDRNTEIASSTESVEDITNEVREAERQSVDKPTGRSLSETLWNLIPSFRKASAESSISEAPSASTSSVDDTNAQSGPSTSDTTTASNSNQEFIDEDAAQPEDSVDGKIKDLTSEEENSNDAEFAANASSVTASSDKSPPAESQSNVLAMYLTIRNKVNGGVVTRPNNLQSSDTWTVEYALAEVADPKKAKLLYDACKVRRKMVYYRSKDGETLWNQKFMADIRRYTAEGKAHRQRADKSQTSEPPKVLKIDPEDLKNWQRWTEKRSPEEKREQ
ncbi:putative mRNA degradation protein, mitochondrial [Glarea lozoyensis 74030]|uniref:Putative mRNA degradation protein, mitochondrial n=1 Tax=Glarea lozoyensis (strain ATCC 74030 / MF5533) TaxID=1104152 RepID=H0EIB2_GLAL7|nr:putative mRNA degradation protein, mitochondrial [Glarea lozoyensis 74030]